MSDRTGRLQAPRSLGAASIVVVAGVLSVAAFGPLAAQGDLPSGAVTMQPYPFRTYAGVQRSAELGRITVPERRGGASTSRIPLAFVRLRSTSATPGPPIVFLMGGPGIPASVMAKVPVYDTLFQQLRALGDVILLDQRGVGESNAAPSCPPDSSRTSGRRVDTLTFDRTTIAALASALTLRCVSRWHSQRAVPTAYTTRESARDIDDVRLALHADQLRLIAFSYGTRLALAYVAAYPQHVARMVLAGTNGPDHVVKLPSTLDLKFRQLAYLARDDSSLIASDPGHTEPDLVRTFERLLERVRGQPKVVSVTDPAGTPHGLRVGAEGLQLAVAIHLDDGRMPAALLATDQGDDMLLDRAIEESFQALLAGATSLVPRAINCSADRSPARRLRVEAEGARALLGVPAENLFLSDEYCRTLGFRSQTVEFTAPVWSSVPTLFVTGTLDSNTPSANAEEVRRGFPSSTHLIVSLAGHETLPISEVQQEVVGFFAGSWPRVGALSTQRPNFLSVSAAKAVRR